MRVFLGMILGAALTVTGAFLYDSVTVPGAMTPPSAAVAEPRPMVNWDVVARNWRGFRTMVWDLSGRMHDGWTKLAG